jgi:hypothetical protein
MKIPGHFSTQIYRESLVAAADGTNPSFLPGPPNAGFRHEPTFALGHHGSLNEQGCADCGQTICAKKFIEADVGATALHLVNCRGGRWIAIIKD